MILFIILAIIAIICTVVVIAGLSIGGSMFVLVFGDVIVCIALIVWILKRRFKR